MPARPDVIFCDPPWQQQHPRRPQDIAERQADETPEAYLARCAAAGVVIITQEPDHAR